MLPHPTRDKLQSLRLHGMLKALSEQLKTPDIDSLSFEERLGLLVDRELTERDDKRLSSRLRHARLRHNACLEDLDYCSPRGLDKALILQLSSGQWLRDGLNLIIGGPTGVGKTWLAFFVWRISGSRLPSRFSVELDAWMIVASTIVPWRSNNPRALAQVVVDHRQDARGHSVLLQQVAETPFQQISQDFSEFP